jgi:hypothetical protein
MINAFDSNESSDNKIEENVNYKGIYYNDDKEEQYFEAGAHFKYTDLYHRLETLLSKLGPERRGAENVQISILEDSSLSKYC